MLPHDWKSRSLALLGMTTIVVGVVLHCTRPNEAPVVVPQIAAAATAIASAKAAARVAEVESDAAVSRATAARARARVVSVDDVMVSATPNVEAALSRVPAPVVERMRLDSTAVVALDTLVHWKDIVIDAQDRRIAADSLELIATSNAFTALQRVKEPRCGRRCGIVLGVGGMLAAAVAVGQVRRTFR